MSSMHYNILISTFVKVFFVIGIFVIKANSLSKNKTKIVGSIESRQLAADDFFKHQSTSEYQRDWTFLSSVDKWKQAKYASLSSYLYYVLKKLQLNLIS